MNIAFSTLPNIDGFSFLFISFFFIFRTEFTVVRIILLFVHRSPKMGMSTLYLFFTRFSFPIFFFRLILLLVQEIEKPPMAIPRRGVVETEQERQWKQLQALRQQQQHQQQLASGGSVPVMSMQTGQADSSSIVQHPQQQQQLLQPSMPSQQQQQQGGFATPIQVSRVRAPGEPIAAGPNFIPRGQPHQVQQSIGQPPVPSMAIPINEVESMADPSGGDRQQLRDLLQRQQMQQQQHRQQHFIKTENIKREDGPNMDGSAAMVNANPQQFAMQQQQRPQFRYPLPPSAAGPNSAASGQAMPMQMQGAPRMPPQQVQQQQHMQQMQQQPRPRVFQPGSTEFRQPIQVASQSPQLAGHLPDPRMRMMMMQQQPQQHQQIQMQRPPGQVQQQAPGHPGGMRQLHPGAMMQQQQQQTQQQPNLHQMVQQQQMVTQPQPVVQQQQQQQQQQPPPVQQQMEQRTTMKVEMMEQPQPCAAAVSAVVDQSNNDADDDFGDLGLGCVDDDELLGLGNDFNILEYADPELHDAMDGVMGQDDHPGGSSSPADGGASPSDFNILEYADPDLDGSSTTTGDEATQRPVPVVPTEQLTPEEMNRRKKEAEEKAAKVAQDMNEFQAKLLELTEQKKQQQLKAEASAQQLQLQMQTDPSATTPGMMTAMTSPHQQQQPQQQQQFGSGGAYQQGAQPPPPYRGPPPPYPGTPRAPSSSQVWDLSLFHLLRPSA